MKCGTECKYFYKMANTDECGKGICSRPASYSMVQVGIDCPIEPKPYRCKDCIHFVENDTACMTAKEDDLVNDCCGFIDARFYVIADTIAEWKMRGLDYKQMIADAIEEAENYVK